MGHRDRAINILRDVLPRAPHSRVANGDLGLALNKLPTLPEAMKYLHAAIRPPRQLSALRRASHGPRARGIVAELTPRAATRNLRLYIVRVPASGRCISASNV